MLQTAKLSKKFGSSVALDALDLCVNTGEVYCLLGANGAGKSTTINLLLGFLTPDGGSARIGEYDTAKQAEDARKLIAYIPEQVMLYSQLSGLENLRYFTRLAGIDATVSALTSALSAAGLAAEVHHQRLGSYSKGMRQKVGIAVALAKQAKVLLLDEPMSGLDPHAANEFVKLVRTVAEGGAAVLMATHDLFRAKQMATRIGILKGGRKVEEFDAAALDATQIEALYLRHMSGEAS